MQVAIVQSSPVPFNIDLGINRVIELSIKAASDGAKVIAFGETFLGGYPIWLDEAPGAALWDHPGTKSLHNILLEQAIVERDPRLAPLQEIVDQHSIIISVGTHERIRSSLYNNQLIFRPGLKPLDHRKLVPTHGERLIWNRGDGSTLDVHQAEWGNVGNLICWEHWMPLARAAMHNLREDVHIAAWPTVREIYSVASRHYAFEGGCYVMAAGTILHRQDLLEGIKATGNDKTAIELIKEIPDQQLQFGGSMVFAPDGSIVGEAGSNETILYAEIDLSRNNEAKAALDTDGHYSRPDVFELHVNRDQRPGVVWDISSET